MDFNEARSEFMPRAEKWVCGYLAKRVRDPSVQAAIARGAQAGPEIEALGYAAAVVLSAVMRAFDWYVTKGSPEIGDEAWQDIDALYRAAETLENKPDLAKNNGIPDGTAEKLRTMADGMVRMAYVATRSTKVFFKNRTFFYCLGYALELNPMIRERNPRATSLPLPTATQANELFKIVIGTLKDHAPHLLEGKKLEYETEHNPTVMRLMKAGQEAAADAKSRDQGHILAM